MEKRTYKGKNKVSLLGLGCMRLPKLDEGSEEIDFEKAQEMVDYAYENGINYFDTAYGYHNGQSELFIGAALKKYPRETFYLASKFPVWAVHEPADVEKVFQEQLTKCQVEYFDFYLLHAMDETKFNKVQQYDIHGFLTEMKKQGKIRNLGFSFHDTPDVLRHICDTYSWDFAQIQCNYLDWELQDAKQQYEILTEREIPVIIMEPVRGGMLANLCDEANQLLRQENPDSSIASWAIRYVASLPNVLTVLSGMSNMEQIQDNVNTLSSFVPFSEEEYVIIQKVMDIYKTMGLIPCTGCRYCMECPFGVNIPQVFSAYNRYVLTNNEEAFLQRYEEIQQAHGADLCTACGSCMSQCPQHIQIPEEMETIQRLYTKAKS